jgi:hypothetical protein
MEDVEPVIAYLNSEGATLLSQAVATEATFKARRGQQQYGRPVSRAHVPNPVLFLLQHAPWVPCEDGQRRRPDQIILNRVGSTVLAGTFHRHAINGTSDLLKANAGRSCVDAVLLRLGAVNALENLSAAQVYDLLLQLLERDPEGRHASAIYHTILDVGGFDGDQAKRDAFCAKGRMWGRCGPESRYYLIPELKYWSRGVLPQPVRETVPLVAIDPRKSSAEVRRVFGVEPLLPGDIRIDVDATETEYQPWSDLATARLSASRIQLYALRLSKNADADGKQRRLLTRVRVNVCRRICATVAVGTRPGTRIEIDKEYGGVVVGTVIYVVCPDEEFPSSDTLFWRAVADLIGDVLDTQVGADFSQVLQYDDERRRSRMLEHLVGSETEKFIQQARQLLAASLDVEEPSPLIKLPDVKTSTSDSAASPPVSTSPGASGPPATAAPAGEMGVPAAFTPTTGPVPPKSIRRPVIVAKRVPKFLVRVHLVDETETLDIVEAFERSERRHPVRVAQIRGYEGPRCDVLSFACQDDARNAVEQQLVAPDRVERFIEVKGRSQRTGAVELRGNELASARLRGPRYYLYRVYCDPADEMHRELAVMGDPLNSPKTTIVETAAFRLDEGSGAIWYAVEMRADGTSPET